MSAIRVRVAQTAGSTPREAGAEMLVWPDRIDGTIGGGALEWEAMRLAREMLADGRAEDRRVMPLGPSLGQCCGGSVTLTFDRAGALEARPGAPLWIYGAGHVGRAIVAVMAPLPDFALTWVDVAAGRYPDRVAEGVTQLVASDPARVVAHAPGAAHHLILTHSHALDLALCDAVLRRNRFASCGVIGSATKWARFRGRLAALGHGAEDIARIACPIGDPHTGKHPQALAIGVAHSLLRGGAAQQSTKRNTG